MSQQNVLYVGMSPRVLALDAATGEIVWATELPNTGIVVTIRVEGSRVYAGSAGEVSCLDAATGRILWNNPLKGMGINPVMFAAENGAAAVAVVQSSSGAIAGASGA